jgi:Protein of unknown function (DUF2950)
MTGKLIPICAALAMVCAVPSIAQERFASAEAAAQAVIDAVAQHDAARISAIFGPSAKKILSSGSSKQDLEEQDEFARMAKAKHRLEMSPMNPNRAILAIGDADWPFPVPILRANGKWSFDPSETPAEMLARRIGTHELDAIEICHGYVEAQMKYASEDRDKDGMLEYAPRLMSSRGKRDGLYWQGEDQPLIPEGLARAAWDSAAKGQAKPYHGYYFHVLEGQGPSAPGGGARGLPQRQACWWIWPGGVAGRIWSLWNSHVHRESARRGLSKRHRARSWQTGPTDNPLRSQLFLETGGVATVNRMAQM